GDATERGLDGLLRGEGRGRPDDAKPRARARWHGSHRVRVQPRAHGYGDAGADTAHLRDRLPAERRIPRGAPRGTPERPEGPRPLDRVPRAAIHAPEPRRP